jgi:ATP-binding cassette subfamily B protein
MPPAPQQPSLFSILTPYRKLIAILAFLTIAANALALWLPKVISGAIDAYAQQTLSLTDVSYTFAGISITIFLLTYMQNIMQTYVSELVARSIRNDVVAKISRQTSASIQKLGADRLLTNLTSDIDSIKLFVSQAVASLISSVVLIIGASVLLLTTNWQLGLAVLAIVPIIGATFFITLSKVRGFFMKSRTVIDGLNRVINESILGAPLVRVLHTEDKEQAKFVVANDASQQVGIKIIAIFSSLIPSITFIASLSTLIILAYGGHLVISSGMSLGDFTAFNTYMAILIFPILIIGFMSNIIAMAGASYTRIAEVLNAPDKKDDGTRTATLKGDIEVKDLVVEYGEKVAVKEVSFTVKAGSRTAIIGPTAAGKTQLLYALTGLIEPAKGTVYFDGHPLAEYDKTALHKQVGFVFQDSITFNMSLRENIAFSTDVTDEAMQKAIETAELSDFIAGLPEGLETVVSEQGKSLSGGQKQRLMLARALALDPKILLLDDFTARVDTVTERRIVANLQKNYPDLTLISVTQKIASVEGYDQIILLMEGELLAKGTHKQLIKTSSEYMQIYTTQQSTNTL